MGFGWVLVGFFCLGFGWVLVGFCLGSGWVLVGYYSDGIYKTEGLAFLEAKLRVLWLNEVL